MKRKLIIAKATKAAIPSDNSYSLKEIDELIANSELAHQATARFRCYTHLNSTLVQMRMLWLQERVLLVVWMSESIDSAEPFFLSAHSRTWLTECAKSRRRIIKMFKKRTIGTNKMIFIHLLVKDQSISAIHLLSTSWTSIATAWPHLFVMCTNSASTGTITESGAVNLHTRHLALWSFSSYFSLHSVASSFSQRLFLLLSPFFSTIYNACGMSS